MREGWRGVMGRMRREGEREIKIPASGSNLSLQMKLLC
jgi:hypothetical protein